MKEITVSTTSNGRITIPAEIRVLLGLQAGDKVVFTIDDDGTIRVRKLEDQPETRVPAQ